MKQILTLAIISSIMLSACQKEITFDSSGVPGSNTGNNGGNSGGTGNTSTNCKSCSYMPVCDGSWYTFLDTLNSVPAITTDSIRFVKDTTIDSKTFVKLYSPLSNSYSYYNCTDGATRAIVYDANTFGGGTISVADIIILKANLPAGGSWTNQVVNPIGQLAKYNFTIKEKGISRTLNGKTYNDVIHVYAETGIDVPTIGFTLVSITDYYFAKNIGLIENIISQPISGAVLQHRVVKSYYVP